MVTSTSDGILKTLIVIAGPTAVGKTTVAAEVANHFDTSIISADSRQFYRDLKIGTAAPSAEILNATQHHFIGHLDLVDNFNVSMFENEVLALLETLFVTHNVVILTGGSGLYIKAVCEGIDDLPDADVSLRDMLNEQFKTGGLPLIRDMLHKYDPEYYNQVDLANPKRILRALEVCLQTGKPYSLQRTHTPAIRDFNIIQVALNLPREVLHQQINARVDQMIEQGLIEEARSFYHLKHLNALNTVGYKELFDYFDGAITLDQAIEKIKTNTRRYARRQITWFIKDPQIKWFAPNAREVIEWLNSKLVQPLQ